MVREFVASYVREQDYYQTAARMCGQRCETLIGPRGVRAIVTWRAKRPNKLLTKLLDRDKTKHYSTSREIRDDLADLAGVRIALYFPGDRASVKAILKENFTVEEEKSFPDPKKPKRAGKRFDGYYADHYRLYMQDGSLEEANKQYAAAKIEVQVGSVLMHAWSEVEHDLIYKPESGTLSEDEEAILDEVNGLVIAGEVALERLQRALERRLSEANVRFDSHYDLAAYLHRWTQGLRSVMPIEMGRVDLLWQLLDRADLNTAARLHDVMGEMPPIMGDRPLADQIADIILNKHPEMYDFYRDLISQAILTRIDTQKQSLLYEAFGSFISKWITLERTYSIHQGVADAHYRNSGDLIRWARTIELPPASVDTIREVRHTRNRLVHAVSSPAPRLLVDETARLDQVLDELRHHKDESVRAAFAEAEAYTDINKL